MLRVANAAIVAVHRYPTVESIADGTLVIVGGSTSGGYINRNTPNVDPTFEAASGGSIQNLAAGGANPTYEYFPRRDNVTQKAGAYQGMQMSKFMTTTSGLNMYPHMFLMPSGRIFMNANVSNVLWDHNANVETALPDTPGGVIRVYPASAATAMKPLTPANSYTPTILFCGGMVLDDDEKWGNYTAPNVDMYQTATSPDCASITPEHADGTAVADVRFETEDAMPVGRTMGQFVHLPTGQMLIVNGGANGTAGYGNTSWNMIEMGGQQVRLEGMASGPTLTPLLYDPDAPAGHRFTDANFGKSKYARLYHSSAILAPDGSVVIGGSNPHNDVNLQMPLASDPQGFNTTYVIEKWYPDYYFAPRPQPVGLPGVLTYGGAAFNVTIGREYMNDSSNALAAATKFMVIRPGFSTHAMNMGQRSLQLQSTYAVQDDGSVVYTVNPLPTNPNLITAGPALLFVTIAGVPSHGKFISVGDDMNTIGPAPWKPKILDELAALPAARNGSGGKFNAAPARVFTGTGPTQGSGKMHNMGAGGTGGTSSSLSSGAKVGLGVGVGVGAAAALAAALAGALVYRKKHTGAATAKPAGYTYAADSALGGGGGGASARSGDALAPPATPFAPYGSGAHGTTPSLSTFDSYSLHHLQPGSQTGSREALTGAGSAHY